MNKITASVAAIGALIGAPAFAADMPVKAPPPAPAPVHSWTGWYVGGNLGYSWGKSNNDLSVSQARLGAGPGDTGIFVLNGSDSNKVNGVIGGAQAGYNWQIQGVLLGFEADIQASGQRATSVYNSTVDLIPNGSPAGLGPNPTIVTDTSKLEWFGTVRGRLGVPSERWLLYVTGGLAYGEVNESGNAQPLGVFSTTNNAPFVWGHSTTKVGWTIGAGIENAISTNWSWKIEYLYLDFGNVAANVSGGIGNQGGIPANCYGAPGGIGCEFAFGAAQGTVTSRFTDNIVRVGLNYQFH